MARARCRRNAGTTLVVVLLVWVGLLAPQAAPAQDGMPAPKRFTFKLDPQTPVKELLPPAPAASVAPAPWLVRELTGVPEILFQVPEPVAVDPLANPKTPAEQQKMMDARDKAMERTAYTIARINHLNQKGPDHFLTLLRQHRPDLDGLPFIMGDACRQSTLTSKAFAAGVSAVHEARTGRSQPAEPEPPKSPGTEKAAEEFWGNYRIVASRSGEMPAHCAVRHTAAQVAALMQMLAPEDMAMRRGLVKYHLAGVETAEATRALAQVAIFSFEPEVRKPALVALRNRRKTDENSRLVADVLLAGLRHPWPAVAQNAGDAVAQLGRKDLLPQLVALLDEPDPRAPVETAVDGKKTLAVREVVRINHHRNCLLCHAPGNTAEVMDEKTGLPRESVVVGAVPSPGQPLMPPSQGYGQFQSPDILVRADVTYLRQDFSMLQAVKNAAPWPAMQRFDFLVRTRTMSTGDATAYQEWLQQQGPDYVAPHRQAALAALRALTGRDAAPTAQAWRGAGRVKVEISGSAEDSARSRLSGGGLAVWKGRLPGN